MRIPSWLVGICGALLVVVGVLAIIHPAATYAAVALLLAWLVLLAGLIRVGSYFAGREAGPFGRYVSGWTLALGILDVLFGIVLLFNVRTAMLAMAVFIGIWGMVRSLLIIFTAVRLKSFHVHSWGWLCGLGALLFLFAFIMLMLPGLQVGIVAAFLGAYFIIAGVCDIGAAFTR